MAKVKGQLHSDLVKGSVGPVTHRLYRGVGTASKRRSPNRVRIAKRWIGSPLDLPGCFSRHSADIGCTLRILPPDSFIKSISDQVGGFGTLSQLIDVNQPNWFPSDPAHGDKPYILPDGVDDNLSTLPIVTPFGLPFDVWIIAADCGVPPFGRALFNLSSVFNLLFYAHGSPSYMWVWTAPTVPLLAPWSNRTTKVWRIKFDYGTIQVFWNGIPMSIPKLIPTPAFNRLQLFASYLGTTPYNSRLFEIATFRRILNPVETQLLLSYYYDVYNLPAS